MAKKEPNITWTSFGVLVLLALALAANFRFPLLESRPMHTDEAILATKYVDFWKTGVFAYDNKDYHGPGLHNLTRAFGFVARWTHPDQLTDAKLRQVVACAGMLLILLTLLVTDGLGRLGTALAMLLMAVSPMMVFYSRYFIMELPLVLWISVFLFACWRHMQSRGALWLVLAGGALGFAHATKETFVLNLGAAVCGWIAVLVMCGSFTQRASNRLDFSRPKKAVKMAWLWLLLPAVLVSVALYSSGFKNWQAVSDSVTTYGHYLGRAEGAGHEKPWHYYLTLLCWRKDGVVWSEGLIVGLAIVGMVHAFLGQHRNTARQAFLIFLSVYALALLTVYSLLSYKTPWSILGAQYALILLAGAGAATLWLWLEGRIARTLFTALLAGGIWHLCLQTSLATKEYRADKRNPYVYSHTTTSLALLADHIQSLATSAAPGTFSLQVINADHGWPLPWLLRKLSNTGYQATVPDTLTASLIVADENLIPAVQAQLSPGEYESSPFGIPYDLRPGVRLNLLVKKSFWEQSRAERVK